MFNAGHPGAVAGDPGVSPLPTVFRQRFLNSAFINFLYDIGVTQLNTDSLVEG